MLLVLYFIALCSDHKTMLVRYLKGCGGVNAFILVISNRDRIDISIQQMLKEYEALFGNGFWKHLIIVVTGVDNNDDLEEFDEECHVIDIQNILKKKFKNLNGALDVVPIGKKTYHKQLPLIMDKMPEEKFICDALKQPYEILKEKYDGIKRKVDSVDETLKILGGIDNENNQEIEKLGQELEETTNEMNRRKLSYMAKYVQYK